jgi:ectoine hydroxylase-related dioxygenase (phytanoyl-CoA dioxygenase family)
MKSSTPIQNIHDAMAALGVTEHTLSEAQKHSLDEEGYVVLENIIDPEWLQALRKRFLELLELEGDGAAKEFLAETGTKRLCDLANKGEMFDKVYTHPKVLAAVYHILQREFHFSSLHARDAIPGEGLQALHCDHGPREPYEPHYVVNSVWLLDDFTEENGATRFVPGTHKLRGTTKDYVKDLMAPHPDQKLLLAPAGSIAIFNSHCWHGGTLNVSQTSRMCLHASFKARDIKQQNDQRKLYRKKTDDRISEAAKYILNVL